MKLTRNLQISPALFGVVPMVNVLFLVVLFFAMSSRFVLQPGMAISLPVSSFMLAPRNGAQIVSVTAAPVPTIYHQDQRVTLPELTQRLAASRAQERSLILKADKGTPWELPLQIINEAQKLGFEVIVATDSVH